MNEIRLTYSGLISFGVLLASIFTGLAFTIIVTRRLTPEEFGLWSLISSLIIYVMIFEPICSYWATRHVARKEEASKTAISGTGIFSIGSIGIYLVIIFLMATTVNLDYNVLLLSTILIPLMYFNQTMKAIVAGFKPQGNAFGMLVFEFTKIPAGFVLVYLNNMGISGAIIATAVANGSQLVFFSFYVKEKLKERFHFGRFKEWLRLSWLPMFTSAPDKILALDVSLFALIIGSISGLAFVGAARTITNAVSYTKFISSSLYPKLLSYEKGEYIELMLDRTLFFLIPFVGISIIFAKPALWILNPIYADAVYVVYVWIAINVIFVFESLFQSALLGMEKVDINTNSRFADYVRSKLFSVPATYIGFYVLYLASITAIFIIAKQGHFPQLDMLVLWGIAGIITQAPIVLIFLKMLRKQIQFKFPYKKSIKYVLATVASSMMSYFLAQHFLHYEKSVFTFAANLIPQVLIFCAVYFSISYLWDRDTRSLFGMIINEFKK